MLSSVSGSPPRMRGKDRGAVIVRPPPGITPAYAGKSRVSPTNSSPSWDHPRVCGEKVICSSQVTTASGSPPRMRGKVAPDGALIAGRGITPAYAGKSCRSCPRRRRTRDHPRVCGEKYQRAALVSSCPGSPPRMRGKAGVAAHAVASGGITPAYAGKSPQASCG